MQPPYPMQGGYQAGPYPMQFGFVAPQQQPVHIPAGFVPQQHQGVYQEQEGGYRGYRGNRYNNSRGTYRGGRGGHGRGGGQNYGGRGGAVGRGGKSNRGGQSASHKTENPAQSEASVNASETQPSSE
ncbi:hypothetical protein BC830DRAFT_1171363 [Chytriomyces sp. MP71]|nr:hypothetical protein BC830DRAFT_1171363 [Chytriomyces sp. MP71]